MVTRTQSLWHGTHHIRRFPSLSRELDVDVVVIGGGITGVTAALLLGSGGRSVALVEHDHLGGGETGHTTSHLTEAIDARYQTLRRDFGEHGAQLVAQSSRDAIDRIAQFVRELSLECGFERLPGYLYSEREADVRLLANELDAAVRAGCVAEWVDRVPLPFATVGGVCFTDQAQCHATAYLAGLIEEAVVHGVRIFEQTRATNVHDAGANGEPCIVHTDRFDLRAKDVFVAANVPINNRVMLHTKIAAYRSYAVAAEVPERNMHGLFWDTDDPYHYTRAQEAAGRHYLIIGGEDHRTGEERDTDGCYARLIAYAEHRFGPLPIRYRWSGQIIEPVDGLPFIGLNTDSSHVYVATGYAGNGITFGTLAGMIVSDRILGRDNPYAAIYDATRVKPLAAAINYVTENVPFPAHLLADRLTSFDIDNRPPQTLGPGEGGIFKGERGDGNGGRSSGKLAVCRDRLGELHACSAVCTHLGCDVAWNHAEQTWDCPCHGSRFSPEGRVINGPAVSDLKPARVPTHS